MLFYISLNFFLNIIPILPDMNFNNKYDMLKVLSGNIEFYPGWKIQRTKPIKAPALNQQYNGSQSNMAIKVLTEANVDPALAKELEDMMGFVKISDNIAES